MNYVTLDENGQVNHNNPPSEIGKAYDLPLPFQGLISTSNEAHQGATFLLKEQSPDLVLTLDIHMINYEFDGLDGGCTYVCQISKGNS